MSEETKMGRPSDYTQELADKICEGIGNGWSMRTVCSKEDMPSMSTVFKWLREREEFSQQYARACRERTEGQHEELLEYGDEAIRLAQEADPKAAGAVVSAVKLKADNLKWSMSKMVPKKYGDRLDLTTDGEKLPAPIMPVAPDVLRDHRNEENTEPNEED